MLGAGILIGFSAILNRLRGLDLVPLSRLGYAVLIGLAAHVFYLLRHPTQLDSSLQVLAAVAAGMFLWSLPGWGKYFSAFHGRDDLAEKEVGWIDRLGYAVYPPSVSMARNRRRGTLCMALRGLYLYPMFVALAVVVDPLAALIGLGSLLQGFAYGIMRNVPERYAVTGAELTFGAIMGAMLVIVLG